MRESPLGRHQGSGSLMVLHGILQVEQNTRTQWNTELQMTWLTWRE